MNVCVCMCVGTYIDHHRQKTLELSTALPSVRESAKCTPIHKYFHVKYQFVHIQICVEKQNVASMDSMHVLKLCALQTEML